jgi:CDP-glucose 4,6-dehydratase
MNRNFWRGRKVFLTGHSGFKGSWLSLWLADMGAEVTGYALPPPTEPNLFTLTGLDGEMISRVGDVRDAVLLKEALTEAQPEVVFHLAAQPLVRESYRDPAETFATNVMGTVNLLEAVRATRSVRAVVNVTSDKCYENREWVWSYRENEPLGGYDPYSASKACSELVTASYRNSFFHPSKYDTHHVAVATARAGNVIGGGDWAAHRLVPDCLQSLLANDPIKLRNPDAVRPWQHVLEPLGGYLLLAEKLTLSGPRYGEAWNFGPDEADAGTVEWLARTLCDAWGGSARIEVQENSPLHEAGCLRLDATKARLVLGWKPVWKLGEALAKTVFWTKAWQVGQDPRTVSLEQIHQYEGAAECP